MGGSEKISLAHESKKTQFVKGIGVTAQIITGKAYLVDRGKIEAPARVLPENQVPWEVERFRDAVEESKKQLHSAKEKLLHEDAVGPAYILDAHLLLLEDKNVIDSTVETIKQSWINSEWALKINLDRLRKIFNSIDDDYLRSRKTDLDYIEQRILRNLTGRGTESLAQIKEEVIVVAHDLSPADTARWPRTRSRPSSPTWAGRLLIPRLWPAPWKSRRWWGAKRAPITSTPGTP